MASRKIGKWEYPYKVWPEDFPHEQVYTDALIEEIAHKYSIPDKEALKECLIRSAKFYLGDEAYYGDTGNSISAIKDEVTKIRNACDILVKRMQNLTLETYEAYVDAFSSNSPEDCGTPSLYLERKFNQEISEELRPSLEEFYTGYDGFDKFNAAKASLHEWGEIFRDASDQILENLSFHSPLKDGSGHQKKPLSIYVQSLSEFWLACGKPPIKVSRSTPAKGEKNGKVIYVGEFLDFVVRCLEPLKFYNQMSVPEAAKNKLRGSVAAILKPRN